MIPASIARTLRTSLNAHLAMVEYLGEQGWSEAEQMIDEAQAARVWLDEQTVEREVVVEVKRKPVAMPYSGPMVHEGTRWPDYGTHRSDYDGRRR
jgi:hypothetical protein